ncbi:MAG: hypothetical protein LBD61_04120 [Endomicrobium sp.]|jgi:hypothetical protein|nr:hypothetical protein [Endomicrobium sp.]
MKNIIKNYYRLNFICAITIAVSILLNIFTISILEKSSIVHLKPSDNVVLNLGGGFLRVYKSINIPVIKITNSILGLSVYENNLTNKKIVICDCFLCRDDGEQKSARQFNLSVNILLLNDLFKVIKIKSTKIFYCNIRDNLNFYLLKDGYYIKFILLFLLLMLVLPRGIPIREVYNKIIKSFKNPAL